MLYSRTKLGHCKIKRLSRRQPALCVSVAEKTEQSLTFICLFFESGLLVCVGPKVQWFSKPAVTSRTSTMAPSVCHQLLIECLSSYGLLHLLLLSASLTKTSLCLLFLVYIPSSKPLILRRYLCQRSVKRNHKQRIGNNPSASLSFGLETELLYRGLICSPPTPTHPPSSAEACMYVHVEQTCWGIDRKVKQYGGST